MPKTSGDVLEVRFKPIGTIRTPYKDRAPFQPTAQDYVEGEFKIVLLPEYEAGLAELSKFRYIYVLSYLDRAAAGGRMKVSPPWAGGREVGLFASRSPRRPNPIGLSTVKLLRIEGNEILTSPLDLLDETPLLDIKPYIKNLDAKEDADCGWLEGMEGKERFINHIRGGHIRGAHHARGGDGGEDD